MKENIPIAILEELSLKNNPEAKFIELDTKYNGLVKLKDKNLNMYFVIKSTNSSGSIFYYKFKPTNESNINETDTSGGIDSLLEDFEEWMFVVGKHNTLDLALIDDNIIRQNEERFYNQFKIEDEDADTSSFDVSQLIFLEKYMDASIDKINGLKTGKSPDQIKDLNDLELDAIQIKEKMTKESKNKTIRRLSRFWGKAQVIGLEVLKEIFINIATEVTKKLLLGS